MSYRAENRSLVARITDDYWADGDSIDLRR